MALLSRAALFRANSGAALRFTQRVYHLPPCHGEGGRGGGGGEERGERKREKKVGRDSGRGESEEREGGRGREEAEERE